ncbi:MAG: ABC transporter substrate-binding protein [Inquilinus sp.]|nr:ABC transporter substrate-binding protein [Inquilinus sp.]
MAAVVALASATAIARTPDDTLVMALKIDDIITLDPAEVFEFSGAEYAAQVYDRLISYDVRDVSRILPGAAESWTISDDGRTFTFKIRDGITFHSGNPLTARDAAFSLRRVVKLDQSPAFILTQLGWNADNVDGLVRALDDRTLQFTTDQSYAPTFVLYLLTAGVGSVVDEKLAMEHEVDGDLGHGWLRTNSAGSGAFKLNAWRPNESLVLDRNDDYWQGSPGFRRAFVRHIPESATQSLLLQNGDIDIARNLTPEQLAVLRGNPAYNVEASPKGAIWYLGLNTRRGPFQNIEVRNALKFLIDYDTIRDTILGGQMVVHQAFLPRGFLGALEETPYSYDPAKARELLAAAGYADGFSITMDTRNNFPVMDMAQAIQASFAEAGIELEIIPGDGSQTLTKYRARNHDIYIGRWGPDYQDPHTNADTFANNPDNSDDAGFKPLAWRNAWDIPALSRQTQAALLERDPARRAEMYLDLQREHQQVSPFVIMFQETEVIASRSDMGGMVWGPSFDDNRYWQGTKN